MTTRRLTTKREPPTADRRSVAATRSSVIVDYVLLGVVFLLALGLRLLVWRWHEPYPLGGDEQEYLNQALTLLREKRYVELRLMRPPLYTGFLALCIYFFDSLVQRLRLIQAIISALTVVPIYALTWRLFGLRHVALVAALLTALNYTLAANATELLTETLFLFGLTILFWLLVRTDDGRSTADDGSKAGRRASSINRRSSTVHRPLSIVRSMAAGFTLGALMLVRSVALPLLPLGALWLLFKEEGKRRQEESEWFVAPERRWLSAVSLRLPAIFVLATVLTIAPWTARNYLTYGAPILIDTTGAENLWLDNDPAGREAVKAQLYAMGEDRAARQSLATAQGIAAITGDPARFLDKAWLEAQRFFALQYFDDMRDRREIWVPPLEVGLRLLLGDGMWLVLLLAGAAGLWLVQGSGVRGQGSGRQGDKEDVRSSASGQGSIFYLLSSIFYLRLSIVHRLSSIVTAKWLFVQWALYIFLTGALFHVELRYRLPIYPVLLPYAAWLLGVGWAGGRRAAWWRWLGAALTVLALATMTLQYRPYVGEAAMLARKHLALWQADQALAVGDAAQAQAAAQAALAADPDSARARVKLARAALLRDDGVAALAELNAAVEHMPDYPYARMLRGALLRRQGELEQARRDLAYEAATLDDAQRWAWQTFAPLGAPPAALEIGDGLDLGYLRGFSHAEQGSFRWSGAEANVRLRVPPGAARVRLRLAPGRLAGVPAPEVVVLADDREIGRVQPEGGWQTYSLRLPATTSQTTVLTLRSDTFRPRDYDPASPDNRELGVMVDRVEVRR